MDRPGKGFCRGSTVSPLGTLRVVKDCGTKEGCSEAGDGAEMSRDLSVGNERN